MDWQTIAITATVLVMPVYAVVAEHRAARKARQARAEQHAEQMRQFENVKQTLAPYYATKADSDGDDGA